MSPRHFLAIFLAELRKTLLRGSGMAALGVAAAVGVLAVGGLAAARHLGGDAQVNGLPVDQILSFTGVTAFSWSLKARNFFLLPLLLLWATGATFAGEYREQTLRELLVRPVPRWAVLLAKLAALSVLSGLTLLVTALASGLPGAALFGVEGDWGAPALGYLASWASDLGLLALGVLASLLFRNVAGVVVGVVLFLALDLGLRLVLKLAGALGLQAATRIAPFLPGEALSAWEGYDGGWDAISFAGLGVLVLLCLGLATWRLLRLDVP